MNSWASNPRGSSPFAPFSFGLSSKFFQLLDPSLWKKNRRGEGDREREREKERNLVSKFSNPGDLARTRVFLSSLREDPARNTTKTPLKREKSEGENARASSLVADDDDDDFIFLTCIFSHPFFRWTTSLFASGIFLSFSSSSFSSSSSSS